MTNTALPRAFYISELAFIERKIEELPEINIGHQGEHKTIRLRDPSIKSGWKRIRYNNATDSQKRIANQREYLINRREFLLNSCGLSEATITKEELAHYRVVTRSSLWDKSFFDSAKDQASPIGNRKYKKFKQYLIFSRAEYIIASELDKMGLMFKYDVAIEGINRTVDFLIYIPSLDCCIALEFFGMMDQQGYMFTTSSKITEYLSLGCRINYEFTMMTGDKESMPNIDEIHRTIALSIANLCDERLVYVP